MTTPKVKRAKADISAESSKKIKETLLEIMRASTGKSISNKQLKTILSRNKVARNLDVVLRDHNLLETKGVKSAAVHRWIFPGMIEEKLTDDVKRWMIDHVKRYQFKPEMMEKVRYAIPEGRELRRKTAPKQLGIGNLKPMTLWRYIQELGKRGELKRMNRGREVTYIKGEAIQLQAEQLQKNNIIPTRTKKADKTTSNQLALVEEAVKFYTDELALDKQVKGKLLTDEKREMFATTIELLLDLKSIGLYFQ